MILFLKTNAFAKEYITYECIGDPSICDDTFIMKFDLKENNNGTTCKSNIYLWQ